MTDHILKKNMFFKLLEIKEISAYILIYSDYFIYAKLFDIWSPKTSDLCYKYFKTVLQKGNCTYYYLYNKLHRLDGPAIMNKEGYNAWYYNNKLHRDDDLPAQIYSNGVRVWYCRGKIHRDKNPAIIYSDGSNEWYSHGIKNRLGCTYLEDKKYYSSFNLHS